jgi:hypothetical protein
MDTNRAVIVLLSYRHELSKAWRSAKPAGGDSCDPSAGRKAGQTQHLHHGQVKEDSAGTRGDGAGGRRREEIFFQQGDQRDSRP